MPEGEQAAKMDLTSSLELTSSLISQLEKAFVDLQAYKNVSSYGIQWEDVEGHFRNLESVMKNKLEELEVKRNLVREKEALVAEREADVASVEQDFLEKVQELKDVAVASIMEARKANKITKVEIVGGKSPSMTEIGERVTEELTQFCKRMDSMGILGYVIENTDIPAVCRKRLAGALGTASDPVCLVLDALGEFLSPTEITQNGNDVKKRKQKRTRQSCVELMDGLFSFLEKGNNADKFLTSESKLRAKGFAYEWKPMALNSKAAINGESLEARAILCLIRAFRIASEFEREELCKFVIAIAQNRQAAHLCRDLNMDKEIPGIVQKLIDSGMYVEAVDFIMAFKLSDAFPPAPLLRTYMEEVHKNPIVNADIVEQYDYNVKDLAARKAVMRCIKEHKLENEHPLDPLRKGFIQLQNAIRDNKSKVEKIKNSKQEEAQDTGGFYDSQSHLSSAPPSYSHEPAPYSYPSAGVADNRYAYAHPRAYGYPVPSPSLYAPPQTSEPRPYSYPVSAPGTEPRPYYYGQDDRVAGSYSGGTPTYGPYVQPPQQPYM